VRVPPYFGIPNLSHQLAVVLVDDTVVEVDDLVVMGSVDEVEDVAFEHDTRTSDTKIRKLRANQLSLFFIVPPILK